LTGKEAEVLVALDDATPIEYLQNKGEEALSALIPLASSLRFQQAT
jgi:hypothetical protein